MKKKKIQKKLDLNKQTISNLGNDEMANLHGGCLTGWICELISRLIDCDAIEEYLEKHPSAVCNR